MLLRVATYYVMCEREEYERSVSLRCPAIYVSYCSEYGEGGDVDDDDKKTKDL